MKSKILIITITTLALTMMSCDSSKDTMVSDDSSVSSTNTTTAQGDLTTQLTTKLQLTADQEEQVRNITEKYTGQMKEARKQGRSMQTLQTLKGINKNRNAEMKEVLTSEQYDIYEKIMQDIQKERRGRLGRGA